MMVMVDGVPQDIDLQAPTLGAGIASRDISSLAFLALWVPNEITATMAADPLLMAGCFKVLAQGSANLGSPETAMLLNLAVAKGTLTRTRADQILAGTAPTAS